MWIFTGTGLIEIECFKFSRETSEILQATILRPWYIKRSKISLMNICNKHEYWIFFKNLIYICLVPHSIWDTLISHVRSVEVPENVNAKEAVTPEAGPTLRYTKGEEDIRNLKMSWNVPLETFLGQFFLFKTLIFFAQYLLCWPAFAPQMTGIVDWLGLWNMNTIILEKYIGKRLMGISNVKSPIWALLQHPKPLQKLDYKVQIL